MNEIRVLGALILITTGAAGIITGIALTAYYGTRGDGR